MGKGLLIVMITLVCIIMFPIGIGIFGAILGGIFGIFGAIFGAIGGIIGGLFGAIFGIFGSVFDGIFGWHHQGMFFHHSRGLVSIIVLAIIIGMIIRQRRTTTK